MYDALNEGWRGSWIYTAPTSVGNYTTIYDFYGDYGWRTYSPMTFNYISGVFMVLSTIG